MKTSYLYVNGILTFPGESKNWTGRAVTWTHEHSDHQAEKIEYFAGPIGSRIHQAERAEKLQKTLAHYTKDNIVLVGHSNGCDVIRDYLEAAKWPSNIIHIHLLSAACEADFDKAGFNNLKCPITIWIATQDKVLLLAKSWIGALMGYGVLGRTGPVNAKIPVGIIKRDFGHSGWFTEEETDKTMGRIVNVYED